MIQEDDVGRCRFYLLALKIFSRPLTAMNQEDDVRRYRFYLLALKICFRRSFTAKIQQEEVGRCRFCFSRPLTAMIQEGDLTAKIQQR